MTHPLAHQTPPRHPIHGCSLDHSTSHWLAMLPDIWDPDPSANPSTPLVDASKCHRTIPPWLAQLAACIIAFASSERRPSAYACRAGSLIVVFILLLFCVLPRILSSLGSCPSLRTVFHRAAVTPPAAHTCQVKEGFYLVCTLDAGAQNQDGKKDIIPGTDGEIKQKGGQNVHAAEW